VANYIYPIAAVLFKICFPSLAYSHFDLNAIKLLIIINKPGVHFHCFSIKLRLSCKLCRICVKAFHQLFDHPKHVLMYFIPITKESQSYAVFNLLDQHHCFLVVHPVGDNRATALNL
jgi:hypothetical protein